MWDKFLKWLGIKKGTGFDPKLQDERDDYFQLGGSLFGYTPKSIRVNNLEDWQRVRDQKLNTCVLESISLQKEPDEHVALGSRAITAYLRSLGQMSSSGTSLSYAQNALKNFGINEEVKLPSDHSVGYNSYSSPSVLTGEVKENCSKHKSNSYWKTYSLNKVLEELDNGRIGHTGCTWYSGYNKWKVKGLSAIIYARDGGQQYGHAVAIVGYDLDFFGQKVLIIRNSFGEDYGDGGLVYLRFQDFGIFQWGVYFNDDIAKDVIGWLSLHQRRAVKEANSPKIWFIEGKKKRHIPDEAILLMLGFNFYEFENGRNTDTEGILEQVEEGEPVKFEEIPLDVRKSWEEIIHVFPFLKDRFNKYYAKTS